MDLNHSLLNSPNFSLHQMDEEKASVEDLLRRGEELLQQTSDEELRLVLLRLQSQYSAHRVRCMKKYLLCSLSRAHMGVFF